MSKQQAIIISSSATITLPFDTEILAGQLRDSSRAMYARDIAAYLQFAGTAEAALEAATLARWRTELAEHTKKSPHTINRMLSAVKRLMAEAAEQGHISYETAEAFADRRGVKVKALKERLRPHNRTAIDPAIMRQMANKAEGTDTLKGLRDAALLHTLASSGLRLAEAASLTLEQIEKRTIEGKQGYILSVCGKTDEEPREAPLSAEAYAAIQIWITRRPVVSFYIFTAADGRGNRWTGRPMAPENIEKTVQQYAHSAGLEHVKPHDFRRFVGTQLAREDIRKAQKALGHKSIETTARHYVLDRLEPGWTDHLY